MLIDTETIDLKKRFIYDMGIIIFNENKEVIETQHLIIKQVYDNKLLFSTAYYGNKRKTYTSLLKGRTAKRTYFGNALRTVKRLLKQYNIVDVFAYNSDFDKGAFAFTSKQLKIDNPLEKINWVDIQALANYYIHSKIEFQEFCKLNKYITPKGYLKCNVEITFEFISQEIFKETHIGIQDAFIELEILKQCEDIETKRKKKFFKIKVEE